MGIGPGSGFAGFFPGLAQGMENAEEIDRRKIQNQSNAQELQQEQLRAQSNNLLAQTASDKQGLHMQTPQVQSMDPVMAKIIPFLKQSGSRLAGLFGKNQAPNGSTAGQSLPPAAQATTLGQSDMAASRPGPDTSSPAAPGVPGASGATSYALDADRGDVRASGIDRANGGAIPGRKGLRMRKPKPGNIAKPTKAAQAAMHPPMEQAPQDNEAMGAEGGPPRNTEASPSNQDPMLANGGAIPGRKGTSIPMLQEGEPKPNPNSLEKDVNNDGQRNRLGRTIKRFDDGSPGGVKKPGGATGSWDPDNSTSSDQPASGLEPAETVGQRVMRRGAKMSAATASITNPIIPGVLGGVKASLDAGRKIANWWNSPADNPSLDDPASKPQPAAAPATQSDAADEGPPKPAIPGRGQPPSATATPAAAVNKPAGHKGGGAPAAQGPPKPTPIDFSNIDVDHRDIPSTSADEWDEFKKASIYQMAAHGVPLTQAKVAVEDQVSDYQHRQFMQMMQQGIMLDGSGDKKGAMAALKTAYQYMPTGHDIQFGIDKTTGNIVGWGINEKTGKPIGAPVKLDQENLNNLLANFSDPKNFANESLAMRKQAMEEQQTRNMGSYQRAEAAKDYASADWMHDRANAQLGAAMIRQGGRGTLTRDQGVAVSNQLQKNGIMDPDALNSATGVAAYLMSNGHSAGDAIAIAGLMYGPKATPQSRAEFAQRNHIPLPEMQDPNQDTSTAYSLGLPR